MRPLLVQRSGVLSIKCDQVMGRPSYPLTSYGTPKIIISEQGDVAQTSPLWRISPGLLCLSNKSNKPLQLCSLSFDGLLFFAVVLWAW
jgi:hypothetical protein